ncbi:MAG: hypothetical protein ACRCU3_04225 [Eubacteriaceae bacterium]
MKEHSKKEFNRLYMSEFVTIIVCGSLIYALTESSGEPLDLRLIIPGSLLIFILLQSTGYWFYRYHQLDQPKDIYPWVMPLFSFLKRLDRFLLLIYPTFSLYLVIFDFSKFLSLLNLFGFILYAFSVIEIINYFYYNVTIGNLKQKNPSELALELREYERKKK